MENIVATLRVETRRGAVRSTDWLGCRVLPAGIERKPYLKDEHKEEHK
jgi:hypothetical protein